MHIDINNIKAWMLEMDYFEFSKLLELEHNPLTITLGFHSDHSYEVYNRIRITPINVKHWIYPKTKKFFPSEATDIRQIDLLEDEGNIIKLRFIHSFSEIYLECQAIKIDDLMPIEIKPKLKFNETRVSLSTPNKKLFRPVEWLYFLKQRNFDASFRIYGGEPKDIESIPEDYTGYCISKNNRIKENLSGIFISIAKSSDNSSDIIFECQDPESYDLWIELIDIFSEIENSNIMIGDVQINNGQWKKQLYRQYKKGL